MAKRGTSASASVPTHHQALVDQRVEPVERLRHRQPADSRRGLQRPAPGEDGEAAEERLLRRREQVVRPGDRVLDRLVAGRGIARSGRQHLQALTQQRQHRGRREHGRSCRGQLDRQGEPVQPPAHLCHRPGVLRGEAEARIDGLRPLHEEGRGGRRADDIGGCSGLGHLQGEDRQELLATHVERGAAGGQDLQRGTLGQQRGHQLPDRGQQVLAVVEQQQELRRAQVGDDGVGDRLIDAGRDAQRGRDGRAHEARIGERREIDKDHAIGKLRGHVAGDGQGQPRLPDAAGTRQGQQRNGVLEQQGMRTRATSCSCHEPRARARQ